MTVDRDELQQIAQLVEANRERMQAIEQQIHQLEAIRIEQIQAIEALLAIPEDGAVGAMIPLGSGVQIVTDIPADAGAVIDIGSRVQAERTRDEAAEILGKRSEEIVAIIERMKSEFDDLENSTVGLAQKFNEGVESMQSETPQNEEPVRTASGGSGSSARRRKRKRGTDLTLDD
ncbi:MAG: prefoldin subunit alpha [Candidatus Thalassarchaeum betae]|nr:prefoldin subunit alpha [Candidatus Thalassoarchaea betae]|tara:strand:+ start:176 stop:700 length:525 start_codon:yes stop_codon:yes gene_type:complete